MTCYEMKNRPHLTKNSKYKMKIIQGFTCQIYIKIINNKTPFIILFNYT